MAGRRFHTSTPPPCTIVRLGGYVSRTSVLAAANPIYGRYDDLKSAAENIDLMTTILSRFDLIFIVRDIRYVKHVNEVLLVASSQVSC